MTGAGAGCRTYIWEVIIYRGNLLLVQSRGGVGVVGMTQGRGWVFSRARGWGCLMSHVPCLMSHVSCPMSHIPCRMSHVAWLISQPRASIRVAPAAATRAIRARVAATSQQRGSPVQGTGAGARTRVQDLGLGLGFRFRFRVVALVSG